MTRPLTRSLGKLLARYGLPVREHPVDADLPGSYWGTPEAGLRHGQLHLSAATPVHSALHEACHFLCMDPARRTRLDTDAGGDDLEESAVCLLQILLADELPGVGRERIMDDMDAWGYSFRLGSTRAWFHHDADDARVWLRAHGLVDNALRITGALRTGPHPSRTRVPTQP